MTTEIPYDKNGVVIKTGDRVIWTDPDPDGVGQVLYEVFGEPTSEMVRLSNEYGECEAFAAECEVIER